MNAVVSNESTAAVLAWDSSGNTRTDRPDRTGVVPDEFNSGAPGVKALFGELRALCVPSDDESVAPTKHALERTTKILEQTAYAMMREREQSCDPDWEFPAGYAATDDEGGIRIEWWHGVTHSVHVVIGHARRTKEYMFSMFGEGDKGRIERPLIPKNLADLLHRLNKVRRSGG